MFLDTSILIELYVLARGPGFADRIVEMIENEQMFISEVQLGEISDWCYRLDLGMPSHINKIKGFVDIVPVNEIIILKASHMKNEMREKGIEKFGLMDGIVLASAEFVDHKLLTTDMDYREAENAIVI